MSKGLHLIQISLKGLAGFVTADQLQLRTRLRDFKYPDGDEARARIAYYRDARQAVVAYHRNNQSSTWLLQRAGELDLSAQTAGDRVRTRLMHNARALREYHDCFANRRFDEVLPRLQLAVMHAGVRVSVTPDLHVRERGKERFLKLEFGVEPLQEMSAKVMTQAMFDAVAQSGHGVTSNSVLVRDVASGRDIAGARSGARMNRLIHATCLNIAAIWDSV